LTATLTAPSAPVKPMTDPNDLARDAGAAEPQALTVTQADDEGRPSSGGAQPPMTYEGIKEAERDRAVEPLAAALDSRDGRIREAAVAGLGRLRDQRATEPLLAALHDPDPFVRAAAAEALPRVARRATALSPLVEALHDDDQLVRARAAEALGEVGGPGAVEPLLALVRGEAPGSWPQRAAATALERLGAGQEAVARRHPLISPLSLWVAGLALFGLGVALASTSGIGFGAGAVGVFGFLLLLGARVQAARGSHRGFFYPGADFGGSDAVWLGASGSDGGGWADFGAGGGGDGGGGF
jgi:hypothetical protein